MRSQGLSLTAVIERQLGRSIRCFHVAAAPNHSSILGQLRRPYTTPSAFILHQSRICAASPTIARDMLRDITILRQRTDSLARATVSSRNATSIALPLPTEEEGRQSSSPTRPIVAYHLFVCAAMVYLIIVVGGLTRLTESGLSITEWNPGFKGMKLPLTDAEWDAEWEKYKGTPEWAM